MASIILHRALFRLGPERIRNSLGRALVIGRKRHPHMTIVQYGVRWTIGFLDLVQGLRDQEGFEAIACHIGQRTFEEVEPAEGRELVQQ